MIASNVNTDIDPDDIGWNVETDDVHVWVGRGFSLSFGRKRATLEGLVRDRDVCHRLLTAFADVHTRLSKEIKHRDKADEVWEDGPQEAPGTGEQPAVAEQTPVQPAPQPQPTTAPPPGAIPFGQPAEAVPAVPLTDAMPRRDSLLGDEPYDEAQ